MTDSERMLSRWLNRGYELSMKLATRTRHLEKLSGLAEMYKEKEIQTYPSSNSSETNEIEKSLIRESIEAMEAELLEIDTNTERALYEELERGAYYTVLYHRYIERLPWAQIATSMGYVERHVYRLHQEAIIEMAKALAGKTIEYEKDQRIIFPKEDGYS